MNYREESKLEIKQILQGVKNEVDRSKDQFV